MFFKTSFCAKFLYKSKELLLHWWLRSQWEVPLCHQLLIAYLQILLLYLWWFCQKMECWSKFSETEDYFPICILNYIDLSNFRLNHLSTFQIQTFYVFTGLGPKPFFICLIGHDFLPYIHINLFINFCVWKACHHHSITFINAHWSVHFWWV